MVWHELTHHLEVVWGALVALVIVVALTPAVGGMARLLGVVDRPEGGRRANPRGVPRLGAENARLGEMQKRGRGARSAFARSSRRTPSRTLAGGPPASRGRRLRQLRSPAMNGV